MAIAYDNSTQLGMVTATSLTASHTVGAGSNRCLVVGVFTTNATDTIVGVTYAGTAMTQGVLLSTGGGEYIYMYYLLNPASGANNVVITFSGSSTIIGDAVSYTGVGQSAQPDATATYVDSTSGAEIVAPITTIADNCWVCGNFRGGTMVSTKAGTTLRTQYNNTVGQYDSNAAITPAGATSLGVNLSPNGVGSAILMSLSPLTNITITPNALTLSTTAQTPTINVLILPASFALASAVESAFVLLWSLSHIEVGTGKMRTRYLSIRYPPTSGLTGGTTKQKGRTMNLVPLEGSLVVSSERKGIRT